ncbi:uncharacterized protein N7483_002780 [Penicillium malachiteum]|uniref:uncharacterized protein n=1 Tax=Penicillium malachiteum TaxID=1324776 RepID=UPI002546CB0D|nr:uncharacterized protein N7483_002780 [Penicillium malachiteum]KAJ5737655.1 hypothetical protein N7483_002780 [Penicillium malachiteum]
MTSLKVTKKSQMKAAQYDTDSPEHLWTAAEEATFQEECWVDAEEGSMYESIEEALSCQKCTLCITEDIMRVDIKNGTYDTSKYPPSFSNPSTRDDDISPFDTSTPKNNLSHWTVITIPQHQRYYELVEKNLNNRIDAEDTADPELAILFAHYQVDYHIQQHYLARRGILTMCRDSKDMRALWKWQWQMSMTDAGLEQNSNDQRPWPNGSRRVDWPNDDNLQMLHATILWKKSWRARKEHLEQVRIKWAAIMEERRRQREALLAKQAASMMRVKLYCGGELIEVRELKRMASSERIFRAKRNFSLWV